MFHTVAIISGLSCVKFMIRLSSAGIPEKPVLRVPPVVVLGQTVLMNCSVRLNCLLAPPRLLWVWERGDVEGGEEVGGRERVQSEGYTYSLISSLSFTPSKLVKPRIRCDAHHHGNRKSSITADINIHCRCTHHSQPVS